jgi:hypothetical protein
LRLSPHDLGILGRYLFGARWKAALAREIKVSDRLVKYWAVAARPTSVRCSALILALVQRRRQLRLSQVQHGYAAMVVTLGAAVPLCLPPPPPLETVADHYAERGFVALSAALRGRP